MSGSTIRVKLSQVELEVVVRGPEDGPAVILLHGFPQGPAVWNHVAATLAAAGYRTIAPAQRGYGGSSRPRGIANYDLDRLAADVTELARALGHRNYAVIGHDWGAAVGWWLAGDSSSGLAALIALSAPHPVVWRRTMVEDPEQRAKSRYVRLFAIPTMPEALLRLTGYRGLEQAIAAAGADAEASADYRRSWRAPGGLTAMLNWYRALLRRPVSGTWRQQVLVPTLFIRGARDAFLSGAAVDQTAALDPGITAVTLADGDHWLPERCPAETARRALAFLDANRDRLTR